MGGTSEKNTLYFIKRRFTFHKVRDTWDKVGPFKLFDQHKDEITEEVVNLSNEVNVAVNFLSQLIFSGGQILSG